MDDKETSIKWGRIVCFPKPGVLENPFVERPRFLSDSEKAVKTTFEGGTVVAQSVSVLQGLSSKSAVPVVSRIALFAGMVGWGVRKSLIGFSFFPVFRGDQFLRNASNRMFAISAIMTGSGLLTMQPAHEELPFKVGRIGLGSVSVLTGLSFFTGEHPSATRFFRFKNLAFFFDQNYHYVQYTVPF